MQCPKCQHQNPPRAKFCVECASSIIRRCATSGTEAPPTAKFCLECAAPLAANDRESSPAESAVSAATVRTAAQQNEVVVEPQTASRQEHGLREMLDLVPHHIVVLGAAGRLLYANRAVLEHYGWTTQHIQASEFDVLVRDIAHPDDAESFLAACARGFAGSSEWEVEARSRRRDGVYRWFLVQGTPLRDDAGRISRWYLRATDIGDPKKAADTIRQDDRELRTLVDFLTPIPLACH